MAFNRVDLPDGQSVDLRVGLTHGQHKLIIGAIAQAEVYPALRAAIPDAYLLAFVIGWAVKDDDGTPIAWPDAEPEKRKAIEAAPEKTADAIFTACSAAYTAWRKDADPNDSGGTSSGSPTG